MCTIIKLHTYTYTSVYPQWVVSALRKYTEYLIFFIFYEKVILGVVFSVIFSVCCQIRASSRYISDLKAHLDLLWGRSPFFYPLHRGSDFLYLPPREFRLDVAIGRFTTRGVDDHFGRNGTSTSGLRGLPRLNRAKCLFSQGKFTKTRKIKK